MTQDADRSICDWAPKHTGPCSFPDSRHGWPGGYSAGVHLPTREGRQTSALRGLMSKRYPSQDDPKWSHLSSEGQATPTSAERIQAQGEERQRRRAQMGTAHAKKLRGLARHPEGTQFSRFTREMLTSETWRALCHSPNAMKVVTRLVEEHMAQGGLANGELICTYDDFVAFGIPRRSVADAISRAEKLGFIDVVRGRRAKGGYDRLPSRYRLTFEPTADGEPRSHRWRNAECIGLARDLEEVRSARAARLRRGSV
jgi:hypothetical protein